MSDKDREFSLGWLEKSRHDLYAVRKLAEDEDGPGDIIAFHCQQSIEKAIKGLLTAYGVRFPRTHDLVELFDLSLPYLSILDTYRDDFTRISRFAVEIRYSNFVAQAAQNTSLYDKLIKTFAQISNSAMIIRSFRNFPVSELQTMI